MSHGKKRQKRLGELLEVPSSILKMDLSAAIEGLEYGPDGNKVYVTTEEESFENPDASRAIRVRSHRQGKLRGADATASGLPPARTGFYVQRGTIWRRIGNVISDSTTRL